MPDLRSVLTGGVLCAAFALAHAEDVREGLWSISLSMTAAGANQVFGPYSKTQCFTQADTRDPSRLFAETGADCTYGNIAYHGSRFSFTIQCGGALPMSGSGMVEYHANAFEGDMTLNADVPGAGQVKTNSHVSGTRLGDC